MGGRQKTSYILVGIPGNEKENDYHCYLLCATFAELRDFSVIVVGGRESPNSGLT